MSYLFLFFAICSLNKILLTVLQDNRYDPYFICYDFEAFEEYAVEIKEQVKLLPTN